MTTILEILSIVVGLGIISVYWIFIKINAAKNAVLNTAPATYVYNLGVDAHNHCFSAADSWLDARKAAKKEAATINADGSKIFT